MKKSIPGKNLAWFGNNYSLTSHNHTGRKLNCKMQEWISLMRHLEPQATKIEQGDSDSDGIYYESEF